MRDFRDAKAMAQTLREALDAKSITISHSESLGMIAKILGFRDWNVLSARIQPESLRTEPTVSSSVTAGAGMPTLPLRDLVLFPKTVVSLFMAREGSKRAVEHAMTGDRRLLVVTQRRAADDHPSQQGLYGVGVAASVVDHVTLDDGSVKLLVRGLERAAIVNMTEGQFMTAKVAPVGKFRSEEAEAFDLSRSVLEEFWAYHNAPHSDYSHLLDIHDPGDLADAIASLLWVTIPQRQDLLETGDVISRLEKVRTLMKSDRQAA
jgi:uncharacterized protein